MSAPVVLYGIENCDQVRKARQWLRAQSVSHHFHDFRADGLAPATLGRWMTHLPWDSLVNRRGLTWRQMSPQQRATVVDQASATELLLSMPTLVKRPVLEAGDRIVVGFSEPVYRTLLGDAMPADDAAPAVDPATAPTTSPTTARKAR
jgi:arsenate reductase (glutaredoxin)